MMKEVDMNLDDAEKEKYKKIKNHIYEHTNAYSNHLMVASGMDVEFPAIFSTVGWDNSWVINEQGSKLLTAQFLCTLEMDQDRMSF
jgi:hypothetical protein